MEHVNRITVVANSPRVFACLESTSAVLDFIEVFL